MTTKTPPRTSFLKLRVEDDLLRELTELARRNERTTAGEARLAIREHIRLRHRHEVEAT